jgi:probable phosphoglycerate mutase
MRGLTSSKVEAPVAGHSGRTRVLIVRHGQSTFNVQQRYQGRSDEPVLTDRGAATAVQVGRHLVTERVDAIISSPLRRALQTAEIITAILRQDGHDEPSLNTNDDLMEVDLPQWEGLALEAVRQQFPDSHRIWRDQPHEFRMSATGRSTFFPVRELFDQANRFWQKFLRHHAGHTVALVTHGGTARALIGTAVGLKPKHFHSLQQSNCGISILEFPHGSSTAQIEGLNSTAHLGEYVPKLKLGRRGVRVVMMASDLPSQHTGHTSGGLAAFHLDFVLTADDPQSKQMARALIEVHPEAQHCIFPGNILFDRLDPGTALMAGSIASARDSLLIGVVVCSRVGMACVLSVVLGMAGRSSLWKRTSNAVLHYPGTGIPPVIQAFNMPFWREVVEPVIAEAYP